MHPYPFDFDSTVLNNWPNTFGSFWSKHRVFQPFLYAYNPLNNAIVEAGQAIGIDQNGLTPISILNRYNEQQKWNKHQLMVEDLPLNQVLKALDQNYKGKIIFNDSALSKIQVNAVLPLDQTQDALKLIGAVFPQLKIYQITPYVIFVTT